MIIFIKVFRFIGTAHKYMYFINFMTPAQICSCYRTLHMQSIHMFIFLEDLLLGLLGSCKENG